MYASYILATLLAVVTAYSHSDFDIKRKIGSCPSANSFLAIIKASGQEVVLKISRENKTDYLLEKEIEIIKVGVFHLNFLEPC
jgi:hypothetical protein